MRPFAAMVALVASVIVAAVFVAVPAEAQSRGGRKVEIWIRAFIPDRHPVLAGYISRTAKGTTVVPAPWTPHLGPLGLDVRNGTCFTGDDRGFSVDPAASARASVKLVLDVDVNTMSLTDSVRAIGPSHNVDCTTGRELLPSRQASVEAIRIGSIRRAADRSVMNVRGLIPNPFYRNVPGAPSIDFEAVVSFDVLEQKITVSGVIGYFPSFEILYAVDGAVPRRLFAAGPEGNSTANFLFDLNTGVNSRNFAGEIDLL